MGRRRAGGDGLAVIGRVFLIVLACAVHAVLGWFAVRVARETVAFDADPGGRMAVAVASWPLLEEAVKQQAGVEEWKRKVAGIPQPQRSDRRGLINAEVARDDPLRRFADASRLQPHGHGFAEPAYRTRIEQQFFGRGRGGFVAVDPSLGGQLAKSRVHSMALIPALALILACWLGMLVCQGEGLELDVQRRRHPMWEWLLSHPIRPAHAFYAELLSPAMTNPIYFAAPLFLWVLFGHVFDVGSALLAALAVGLPLAVVAAAANKAIETVALLRLGVRSRGAVLGVLSWIGYVVMLLPFFTLQSEELGRLLGRLGARLAPFVPSFPIRALITGWSGETNLGQVVISWWLLVLAIGVIAAWLVHRATAFGLQAPSDTSGPTASALLSPRGKFGADPLRRKELLWILRDKSAVVQIVLIPLTIGASQAFNVRGIYRLAGMSWSTVCGLAIICGTYFLLVLGPRSLASEGAALWIALTWPRGLEALLKAKARLWSNVANAAVGCVLAVAVFLFPAAWWKIVLTGGAWLVFSRTLALKSVALVTAPSASGEPEPPNRARQWFALIGTLAFGTGIVTGAWHVAVIGLVFSSLVAVAMWQELRVRLPHIFDPWSEKPLPAPSLMHTTVGIALLAEFIGFTVGVAYGIGGDANLWLARAVAYGVAGAIGCIVMDRFLAGRGVGLREILVWADTPRRLGARAGMGLAVTFGAILASVATAYLALLRRVPAAREAIDQAARSAAQHDRQIFWIVLLSVVLAPVAEEYFFRGLLLRALDRELGGWRAWVLSAGFFAIFHPPLAWLPVFGLGLATAWLFCRTRTLFASIVCHLTYNGALLVIPHLVG